MNLTPAVRSFIEEQLRGCGRLAGGTTVLLERLPGNADRIDRDTRRQYLVREREKTVAMLVAGTDLRGLRERTTLFAQAYPELACPILSHATIDGVDLLLTEYFDGSTASSALANAEIGERGVLNALEKIASRFRGAVEPSRPEALAQEFENLCAAVLAIPYWSKADRCFLEGLVFPFAKERLNCLSPSQRVSNGDLVLGNILLNGHGEIRVVDYEQAARTHFHEEDWLRLTYWKAPPALRDFALRQVGDRDAVQLYLWLKQLHFEAGVNVATKAREDLEYWGRQLRRTVERAGNDTEGSLLWPTEKRSPLSQLLLLQTRAQHNYTRSLQLYNFARQREQKLRNMQASFSWRATAWLRALRRTFVDPYFKRPSQPLSDHSLSGGQPAFPFSAAGFFRPEAVQLHCHVENVEQLRPGAGSVIVKGWVYTDLPVTLTELRARVGEKTFLGSYGLERPDVAEKFLGRATSGFSVEVTLDSHDTEAILEVSDDQGLWYPFLTKALHEAPPPSAGLAFRDYTSWVAQHDTFSSAQLESLRTTAKRIPASPRISIVMPVYNVPGLFLTRAIESVREQVYPHWELCIADDASTKPHIRPLIEKYTKLDPRIRAVYRTANGHISAASNSALELASGDYTVFLDHDDELAPHALLCVAQAIAAHPAARLFYSDEDKIDEQGQRFDPHFKPDWNPDLLTSQNYLCHLVAFKTALLREVGGLRAGFEGSQDWDVALRISERLKPEEIIHIARILYHWRAIEGSTATTTEAKPYANRVASKVLEEHFQRRGESVKLSSVGGHWRVHRAVPKPPPAVTLIVPTRNRRELLIKCVESILDHTRYPNFDIVIADNDSDDAELHAYYRKMSGNGRFSVVPCPGPFNFSAINNRAAAQAKGEILGFLNNDLEVIDPDWLGEMVSHATRPEIGVVGAKLYYPDQTVQHAGVITGIGGVAGHAFKHFPRNDPGTPQCRPHLVHNVSAVTGACALVRKDIFERAGRFDEVHLPIAFNDVDLCLRVQALGYRNLFTPFATFIHHESASRGAEDTVEKLARFHAEVAFMKQRWGESLDHDPAYNPNLSLEREDFSFASPPRLPALV